VKRDIAPLTEEQLGAWHGMLRLHSMVLRRLDQELTWQHRLPVRAFDVLITLFNAPDRRRRMSELAERVMLTPSGLTRLVERLEREHLVERQSDPADARSFHAVLTDLGLQRLNAARTTHDRVIRECFTDQLSTEDLRTLAMIWEKILGESSLKEGR
jgi:DNA-binding MarR family transcriptional regulator